MFVKSLKNDGFIMLVGESKLLCSEVAQIIFQKRISGIQVEMHIDDGIHKMHKHLDSLVRGRK